MILPFYGGGKGQSLQIVETSDGKIITTIIKTPDKPDEPEEETINPIELENPQLPSNHDSEYGKNIKNIHHLSMNIMKLQELAKKRGKLTEADQNLYQQNMNGLSESASNLAKLQESDSELTFENREGLSSWFERQQQVKIEKEEGRKKFPNKHKGDKNKEDGGLPNKNKEDKETAESEDKNKEENKNENKEQEKEEEKEPGYEVIEENEDEDVEINIPPEDTAVAEAKPIGLAVAGEGGIAASKPIATAVVGPGGLAIARPVATAIAGVAPDQSLVPIYAEGYIGAVKPHRSGASKKPLTRTSDYLNRIITKFHNH